MNRREFLTGSMGATLLASLPADLLAQPPRPPAPPKWDPGRVRAPAADRQRHADADQGVVLEPLSHAPTLRIGATAVPGRMNDTPANSGSSTPTDSSRAGRYSLSLIAAGGARCASPGNSRRFPARRAPERFRVLFFTCAGGHEGLGNLPAAVRNRLLRRALSFGPSGRGQRRSRLLGSADAPRSRCTGDRRKRSRLAGASRGRRWCSATRTRPC